MQENRNVEVEKKTVDKKSDTSKVWVAVVKYTAYLAIFFGFLYFLVRYVFPMFS